MVIQPVEFWFSCGHLCVHNAKLFALVLGAYQTGATPAGLAAHLPADVDVVYALEPAGSDTRRSLAVLPEALRYVTSAYDRQYIDIKGSFESYFQKLNGRTRQNWRRTLSNLSRASGGEVRWRQFKHPDHMEEFHAIACEVVRSTYQKKLYNAGIPEDRAFRDQLIHNAHTDAIRGYVLFLNDRPIAFNYCYALDDVLVGSKLGYDPAYAQYSPGTVLLHLIIESLFRGDRFRLFDFGRGEFTYKVNYATHSLRCVDAFYFPRTAGNLAFAATHFGTVLLSRWGSAMFAAIGAKDAAKWILRNIALRRHGVSRGPTLDRARQS